MGKNQRGVRRLRRRGQRLGLALCRETSVGSSSKVICKNGPGARSIMRRALLESTSMSIKPLEGCQTGLRVAQSTAVGSWPVFLWLGS